MASIGRIGGFTHEDNELNLVSAHYQTTYSPRKRKLTQIHTLRVSGEINRTGAADITTRAIALFNAYDQDYQDFTYTVNDVVAHRLYNGGNCISGVKVISKSFPMGGPEELCTTRTFSATLQATYDVCEDNIVEWTESLSVTGTGGPVKSVVNTVFGPIQFYYAPASAVYVTQSGTAVGFNTYPDPPPPIGDDDQMFLDRRNFTQTSGIQQGTGIRFYRTSWKYPFVFSSIHNAFPTSR